MLSRLNVRSNSDECNFNLYNIKINQRSDGFYLVLYANGICAQNINSLNVEYQLFFEVDTQHQKSFTVCNRCLHSFSTGVIN